MRRSLRIVITLAIMAIFATGAYAFTASNFVAGSTAGDGDEAISPYNITNVNYDLNDTDPGLIDSVSFDIAPVVADEVFVQLISGGDWFECINAGGAVTCDLTGGGVTTEGANNLRVAAAQ